MYISERTRATPPDEMLNGRGEDVDFYLKMQWKADLPCKCH